LRVLEYKSGPGEPFMRRLLILILVIAIGATSVAQPPTLTKHAMQVRKKVGLCQLVPGSQSS
jgi:hypothetical protein